MIVPFQMVMYTLAGTADTLRLNTPWSIPIVYLGFGAIPRLSFHCACRNSFNNILLAEQIQDDDW